MKFLLINPIIGARKRLPAYFPLGLGYIAQSLLDEGHAVEVLDINAHRWSPDDVEERVRRAEFDAAGITGMVTEFASVRWLSDLIKEVKPTAKVVLGGGLPTAFPRLLLERTRADIAVVGEGEATITEVAKSLAQGTALSSVTGIWYRDGGQLRATGPRELIEDLDGLPFPARHLFPMEQYIKNPVPYLRMFNPQVVSTNIVSSRGCPYKCAYCFHGLWGHRFRGRSADNIVAEMKHLRDKYGINGVFFMDDTFVLDRKRLLDICDELVGENLGIMWAANGRVNLMDRHTLQRMRAAGCRVVAYGIESGSQKMLDEMRKGVTVDQAREAVLDTWRAGILPVGYLMIGMFGETPGTVTETVRFCNQTGLISKFAFATPFPGTELYARAVDSGRITPDGSQRLLESWDEWTDRILVNLTDLPDHDLRLLKRNAERRILLGNCWSKLFRYVHLLGIRGTVRESALFLMKALRLGHYT